MFHPKRPLKVWAAGTALVFVCSLLSLSYMSQEPTVITLAPPVFSEQQEHYEKFITYLPHSGLHNQRSALINALILAKVLNRTLIMPEVNIGTASFWRPTPLLGDRLDICIERLQIKAPESIECFDYKRYVPVPVHTVFDLNPLKEHSIKVLQRHNLRQDYFQRFWSVPNDARNKSLALSIKDTSRYSYQFHDTMEDAMNPPEGDIYDKHLPMEELANRPEPFLIFGSMFGNHRVESTRSDLILLRRQLRREIKIGHPLVVEQASEIIRQLGGKGAYGSVHLRQGDGIFKQMAAQTIKEVRTRLETIAHPHQNMTQSPTFKALAKWKRNRPRLLKECLLVQKQKALAPQLQLIYMATDAKKPRKVFADLYNEFICLFSLEDFPNTVDSIVQTTLATMDSGLRPDGGGLLLPLVDASVASYGSFFMGTPRSTFSEYVQVQNRWFHQRLKKGVSSLSN